LKIEFSEEAKGVKDENGNKLSVSNLSVKMENFSTKSS